MLYLELPRTKWNVLATPRRVRLVRKGRKGRTTKGALFRVGWKVSEGQAAAYVPGACSEFACG
jgi:hypothetical protein